MQQLATLSKSAHATLKSGGVFIPSPLALDKDLRPDQKYQMLLTLYYIKSGAKAVIPGAHTGEFALGDLKIFSHWVALVREMTDSYGKEMVLMAAIGGKDVLRQAEVAVRHGFDLVMVAPTAFEGRDPDQVIELFRAISAMIPTIAFELQRAIPGSYPFSYDLWSEIFQIAYGAKGASFDTYRSMNMLKAAAASDRSDELVLFTGNDDRIVADLMGEYSFHVGDSMARVHYDGGLLGHFATDTLAAVEIVNEIKKSRLDKLWRLPMSREALAHAVNQCNMELFDALGNFENSVWGVKYRLASMGLLSGPYCAKERGRKGQARSIDQIYRQYPHLNDGEFVKENISWMKKEIGIVD